MKLWKNISLNKDHDMKQIDNIKKLSLKSTESIKFNPINKTNQSNESKILLKHLNKKDISFYSSSSEEKNMESSKKDQGLKKLFENKNKEFQKLLITTTNPGSFSKHKNNNNSNRTIYPKIPTKENRNKIFKSISSFAYNKNKRNFKIKLKKGFTPLQPNNTILNKFSDDFHKIFFKSLKRAKQDFSSTYQKFYKRKKRIKINFEKKILKNLKINNKNEIDNSDNNNLETLNYNNDISPERKKNPILKSLQLEESSLNTSPYQANNNNFSKSPKKKIILTVEQYSQQSSMSSKTFNKFDCSQPEIKLYKNYKRKRNFKEYMKETNILNSKWKKKIGILDSEIKYSPALLCDLKFQSNTIKDEMNLLIDGIHHYKMGLFGNSDLITAFMNKDIFYQINLNKTLEETCALLHLIPKILLKEYYIYADRFISIPEPGKENFITKIVTNESDCLNENIRLLYRIITFVKSSYEVYIQLVSQVEEEMIISHHEFEVLRAIFQKCRYYIGNLINFANNILKDYNFDKKLIKKCKPILEQTKDRLKEDWRFLNNNGKKVEKNKRSQTYFNYQTIKSSRDIISTKMNSNFNLTNNDYYQKVLRITKALENLGDPKTIQNNYADELKLRQAGVGSKNGPMALIFSPLMTKMLKYIRKDIREKIISLRSSRKYIDSK